MKINTRYHQWKTRFNLDKFRDIRFTGQIIFVLLVLLISWSGVKAIQTNYGLEKQVSALAQQNAVQKLEDENLQLQNKYYDSNQYLELSARQNFGLANPGEKELLVPETVAMAYTVNLPLTIVKSNSITTPLPPSQKNFEAWIDFFAHRSEN